MLPGVLLLPTLRLLFRDIFNPLSPLVMAVVVILLSPDTLIACPRDCFTSLSPESFSAKPAPCILVDTPSIAVFRSATLAAFFISASPAFRPARFLLFNPLATPLITTPFCPAPLPSESVSLLPSDDSVTLPFCPFPFS